MQRYVEFKPAALDAGIDETRFETHFTPDDTIRTPVRLRKSYPTVEWRSPDATLSSQVLRLAEEAYAAMERADRVGSYLDRMGFDVDAYDPLTARTDGKQYVSEPEACGIRTAYAHALERDISRLVKAKRSV